MSSQPDWQTQPQQPYPVPGTPPQVVVAQLPPTSGLAVASLIFGVLGIVLGCCSFGIFSIVAVMLGHAARHETKNGAKRGDGMAMAGLILGYLLVVPMILLSIQVVLGAGIDALDG